MKKIMLATVVAIAMVAFIAVDVKADEKCAAGAKKEAAVCEACTKLAKDVKAGEQANPCDACAKKCGAKAEAKTEKKAE